MKHESNFYTTAKNNKCVGEVGLIQFTPRTAKGMGTSTEELGKMTDVEQMHYVERFLRGAKRIAGFKKEDHLSGGQLYGIVAAPGWMANRPEKANPMVERLQNRINGIRNPQKAKKAK